MMIVTVEFGLKPGTEIRFQEAVDQAHAYLRKHDGFLGEEPCRCVFDDQKFLTVFYFRDRESIRAWYDDADHKRLQRLGKDEIFAWYRIRVAEVERQYGFNEVDGSGLPTA